MQSEETTEDTKEGDVYKTIAEYAAAVGGTRDDLDEDLQEVSLEHLANILNDEWE